jgi:hypothetical protein
MPTRKIADLPKQLICKDPDHNIPTHQVFDPGTYEHECPSCERKFKFTIHDKYTLDSSKHEGIIWAKHPNNHTTPAIPVTCVDLNPINWTPEDFNK